MRLVVLLISSLVILTGCQLPSPPQPEPEIATPYEFCPEDNGRELVACPMNWAPVCAQLADYRWETYANDCDACANGASRYVVDACDFVNPELLSNG